MNFGTVEHRACPLFYLPLVSARGRALERWELSELARPRTRPRAGRAYSALKQAICGSQSDALVSEAHHRAPPRLARSVAAKPTVLTPVQRGRRPP